MHVEFDCSCFTLFSRTILETQRLYQGSFNTDGIVYFGGSLDKEERHQRNNKIVYVAAWLEMAIRASPGLTKSSSTELYPSSP